MGIFGDFIIILLLGLDFAKIAGFSGDTSNL